MEAKVINVTYALSKLYWKNLNKIKVYNNPNGGTENTNQACLETV